MEVTAQALPGDPGQVTTTITSDLAGSAAGLGAILPQPAIPESLYGHAVAQAMQQGVTAVGAGEGTGEDTGQSSQPTSVAVPTAVAASAQRKRRAAKSKPASHATASSADSTASSPAAAAADRSVNIILPAATYDWFEKQAAAADYEPSLAKYLQWQLRKLEKDQRVAAMPVRVPLTPLVSVDLNGNIQYVGQTAAAPGYTVTNTKGIDE